MKTSNKTSLWRQKVIILISVGLFNSLLFLQAQDTISNGNAFNFPFRKFGISIGNSKVFSGFRLNYADKNVIRINGVNLTLWVNKLNITKTPNNYNAVVNGISLGMIPVAASMQPFNIGIIGISAKTLNGFTLGGLTTHSFDNTNGICISALTTGAGKSVNGVSVNGLWTESNRISGLSISGLVVGAYETINGIAFGGLGVASDKRINAIAMSVGYIGCEEFKGIAVTPGYLESDIYKGIAIAGYNNSGNFSGFSFAIVNKTRNLKGVQIGVLNLASNNRKAFKVLPLINMHLRKEL